MITTNYKDGTETEKHESGVEVIFTVDTLTRMKLSVQKEIDNLTDNLDNINSRIGKCQQTITESKTPNLS